MFSIVHCCDTCPVSAWPLGTWALSEGTCASGRQGGWRWAGRVAYLGDEELGEALRQPALLTGENQLQHVPVQLLHHHEHLLRRLEHALQVHDPRVPQALGWGVGWCWSRPRSPLNLGPLRTSRGNRWTTKKLSPSEQLVL